MLTISVCKANKSVGSFSTDPLLGGTCQKQQNVTIYTKSTIITAVERQKQSVTRGSKALTVTQVHYNPVNNQQNADTIIIASQNLTRKVISTINTVQ